MIEPDPIKEMAAKLRHLVEEKAAAIKSTPDFRELLRLHKSLNGLEGGLGEGPTPLVEFLGLAGSGISTGESAARSALPVVRVDEFFNMEALDAAKAYIKKHRDARSFQEIVTAIRAGGGKVEDEAKLRTGLGRSTLDVVKFGDHYGWLDNYPEERAKRMKGLRKKGDDKKDDQGEDAATSDTATA
jgi:hypothetical protein